MKEANQKIQSVESYRTPQFKLSELLKSIFTLGRVKQKRLTEAAALYVFEYKEKELYVISAEEMSGKRTKIVEFQICPLEFEQIVYKDKKLSLDNYIYHFDLDTIIFE
ncbi:hypothetical protein ACEN4P_03650 [Marinilactibacillus psychrotolerans]|uniref:Uncharacterized protein n=2 Tax=Marinilactibacillus psychrotolerans TaxID=191770 RepID=A0A511GYZ2_9LACT|nr:hypothetical protein [Marinilactibacillus psychrotolerans]TLQ05244.1 hypothetical protein FEZ48_12635 [Marinilactibacillus psychrotolerans]SDD17186.1 hypothetical protein SAMN04488013_11934 [Marinilactibacillus psychrotolerans]SJN29517.1 hypothetical protein FM115_04775 [Marinilactibacillus psychrotolerans 42ea]GEL66384.1 hypothetical protein MPS01_05390 [Marinilactibacillus psychrotolerans]GEQ33840.1 hypothetical protein B795N_17220 [Marinilactibacillus psychrotolerans]